VPNRRGNPNWTLPLPVALTPGGASAFEHLVVRLGLSPKQYQDSTVLREWVQKNKNYRYVPSELLQAWGFKVDTGYEISRERRQRVRAQMSLD